MFVHARATHVFSDPISINPSLNMCQNFKYAGQVNFKLYSQLSKVRIREGITPRPRNPRVRVNTNRQHLSSHPTSFHVNRNSHEHMFRRNVNLVSHHVGFQPTSNIHHKKRNVLRRTPRIHRPSHLHTTIPPRMLTRTRLSPDRSISLVLGGIIPRNKMSTMDKILSLGKHLPRVTRK